MEGLLCRVVRRLQEQNRASAQDSDRRANGAVRALLVVHSARYRSDPSRGNARVHIEPRNKIVHGSDGKVRIITKVSPYPGRRVRLVDDDDDE